MNWIVLFATALVLSACEQSETTATSPTQAPITSASELYCRDDTGAEQPFVDTTYNRFLDAHEKLGLQLVVKRPDVMIFSDGIDTISYELDGSASGEPVLTKMYINEELTEGTEMCWKVFAIAHQE